jgi:DNA topoisomerase VI subunit B
MQKDPPYNNNANSSFTYHIPENADESLPPPSRIPLEKWQEILEEEYDRHVIGSIREEIVQSAVDTLYNSYLQRTVYGFVINRVREDWMRIFQVI